MIDLEEFDQAELVMSDGDFYSLVRHLYELDELKVALSPSVKHCSSLLRKKAKERVVNMSNLRNKLEF
jgi:hypothetical protein